MRTDPWEAARQVFCKLFCRGCGEPPHEPAPTIHPKWSIGTGGITINLQGVFQMNINSNLAIALAVVWVWTDKDGNTHPAKIEKDSTVITCDRPDLYTMEQDPTTKEWKANPLPADQLPASGDDGAIGTATFTAEADADRSEGVRKVFAVGSVVMIEPEAETGSINFTPQ